MALFSADKFHCIVVKSSAVGTHGPVLVPPRGVLILCPQKTCGFCWCTRLAPIRFRSVSRNRTGRTRNWPGCFVCVFVCVGFMMWVCLPSGRCGVPRDRSSARPPSAKPPRISLFFCLHRQFRAFSLWAPPPSLCHCACSPYSLVV